MRLGQKNPRTRRWARRGTRPRALADLRTQSAYLFGAICPELGTGAAVVMPHADTEAMQHHLDEIARCAAPGTHGIVVLDQAGWHTTGKLRLPTNVSLLALPPKSPELNPAENVWQFLRQTKLSNRIFDGYEAIVTAACEAWNSLIADPAGSNPSEPASGPSSVTVKGGWYKPLSTPLNTVAPPCAGRLFGDPPARCLAVGAQLT